MAFCHQHQVLRQKRAVGDEAIIALNIEGIGFIIMDAMAVHGEGGISEQFGRGEAVGFLMGFVGSRGWRRRFWRRRVRVLAVNEVLVFGDTQGAGLVDVVAQGDEGERASAAGLLCDRRDCGGFGGGLAGEKRRVKLQRPTRPHAAGQAKVGDETAGFRMTILPESFWRLYIPEIYLVPEGRQGITRLWWRGWQGKSGVQGRSTGWVQCAGSGL